MKKLVIILLMSILLTGCVHSNATLDVNWKGNMDFTLLVTSDDTVAMFQQKLLEASESLKKEGFSVAPYENGIKIQKHLTPENTTIAHATSSSPSPITYNLTEDKGIFINTLHISSTIDLSKSSVLLDQYVNNYNIAKSMYTSIMKNMDMSLTVNLPLALSPSNNATSVENDGKTLRWKFQGDKVNMIQADINVPNVQNIAIALCLGLILLISFIIWRMKKRKNN